MSSEPLRNVRSPPGAEPGRPQPEGETAVRKTGLLTAGRNLGCSGGLIVTPDRRLNGG